MPDPQASIEMKVLALVSPNREELELAGVVWRYLSAAIF